ncbi:MAG TPA: NAD-dependent epimerase/dehydratase family protein [Thermoleophilia bacterium]|nr:NAD-dependent epimerase/dehydratase family protein [Thermoleophilia bacterium]
MSGPQYLVTGGAGFIGSHVVERLLAAGAAVRVLDDFSTGKRENLSAAVEGAADATAAVLAGPASRLEVVEGDVRDAELVRAVVEGCDAVLHLAAIVSVTRSVEDPVGTGAVTHGGTVNVATQAGIAGVPRVVLASSCAVYGDVDALPLTEDVPPRPLSPYAAAKLGSEETLIALARGGASTAVCLRLFNVYGPRQDPGSEYSGVVALFADAAVAGSGVIVYGDGLQTRDFVYVDDVAAAFVRAAEAPAGRLAAAGTGAPEGVPAAVVNVGTGAQSSVLDLVAALRAASGRDLPVEHRPARAGDIRDSQADVSRAAALLDWRPEVSLTEGLARTYAACAAGVS